MTSTLTVGWSVTGRPGRFLCPVHMERGVEALPVSLTEAKVGDLRCVVCGGSLACAERSGP